MILSSGEYRDNLSKTTYRLSNHITFKDIILIKGSNGVGKTRFIEGVLLKELRREKKSIIYFGQDLENQILTYELISVVKEFISKLKSRGNFLKAVLFNDDSHNSIEVDFNSKEILNPSLEYIREFIKRESLKYDPDIVIYDEVDKFFDTSEEFINLIKSLKCRNVVVISHLLESSDSEINLTKSEGVIDVQ